jgi:hypothetical protein
LLPIIWKTRSGIEAGVWAGRLMALLQESVGILMVFVFSNKKGKLTPRRQRQSQNSLGNLTLGTTQVSRLISTKCEHQR